MTVPIKKKIIVKLSIELFFLPSQIIGISEEVAPDLDWKQQYVLFNYDKARDVKRKQQVAALQSRTQEQLDEEEQLVQEFKRIETNHKNFRCESERKDLEEVVYIYINKGTRKLEIKQANKKKNRKKDVKINK